MEPRVNFFEVGKDAMNTMFATGKYLAKSPIEKSLQHLLSFRVSQINGCAFCLDMHSKDLRAAGETEQRLYMISAWRESDLYTDRERAALAWAEAVTTLPNSEVPDDVYEQAKAQFSELELVDLTVTVNTINAWNRLNIAFRAASGHYQPGMFASVAS